MISLPFLTSFFSLCSLQSPRCGDQKRSEQPEQPADGLQGPAPLCRRGEALAGHLQGALFLVHHVPWLHTHCLRACRTCAAPSRCAGISDDAGFQTAVKATQETVRPSYQESAFVGCCAHCPIRCWTLASRRRRLLRCCASFASLALSVFFLSPGPFFSPCLECRVPRSGGMPTAADPSCAGLGCHCTCCANGEVPRGL